MNFHSLDYLKQNFNIRKTSRSSNIGKVFKFTLILILLSIAIFETMDCCNISIGQQIYVNKTTIETIVNLKTLGEIMDRLEELGSDGLSKDISIMPCVKRNLKMANTEQAIDQIFSNIALKHFKVTLNGHLLCYTDNYTQTKSILENYKTGFINTNLKIGTCKVESEIVGNLQISPVKRELINANILNSQQFKDFIKNISELKVKTKYTSDFEEEIRFQTQRSEAENLFCPKEIVIQKGIPGLKKICKELTTIDGEIQQDSVIIQEKIVKEPVAEIIKVVNHLNFAQPTMGVVTSRFGIRHKKPHHGVDIANVRGTKVYSAEYGVVKTVSRNKDSYGNLIVVEHVDGFSTYYAHLSKIRVYEGQKVSKGTFIGEIGNTGRSGGDHLHFEVRKNGQPLDPKKFGV